MKSVNAAPVLCNKKLIVFFFLLLMVFGFSQASAQGPLGRTFGLGIQAGDPMGATGKFFLSDGYAVQVNLGASYFGNPRITVDYIWNFYSTSNQVDFYIGAGGVLGFGKARGPFYKFDKFSDKEEMRLGARGVFGAAYNLPSSPIELYSEISPLLGIVPVYAAGFDFVIGGRFYFP